MTIQLWRIPLAAGLVLSSASLRAQHGHTDVGAVSTNQNAKLIWANGADFVAESGYVKSLEFTNAGLYSNYFQGNITHTVLPATAGSGGPDSRAPALGSRIVGMVSSVKGPSGGEFGFWDTNFPTGPKIVVPVGGTNTNTFFISSSAGAPGADPFGHIHGRRMSLSTPGHYKVGFKALDISTNGAGGGPIHAPSDELIVQFQAGLSLIASNRSDAMNIHFGSIANRNHILEFSTNLAQSNWTALATNAGNDHFQTVRDANAGPQRFYRQRLVFP